ncbi:MAG: hypothetical protein EBS05_24770 [Proteobacteria bacterium]|nr:hypothetical protein [Pseudomonadota bacterium]NDF00940.1 hypothetical protein [Verrucomicrobiota bacterium]
MSAAESIITEPLVSGTAGPRAQSRLHRAPGCTLVLAQSWVPFSVSQGNRSGMRQSTLRAARAFTLLSSELAIRHGGEKPSTA